MILLDYSQTVIGSFMAMGKGKPAVEEDLLRHTILNTIRMINYWILRIRIIIKLYAFTL